MPWIKNRFIDLLAILLGMMLVLAFAPYDIYPLAVIVPALFIALLFNASAKRSLYLGFLFGAGFNGAGVYWIYISVHYFGGVSIPLATIITAGMIAILASYPAVVFYLANRFFPTNDTPKLVAVIPSIWVLSEWVRSWLFTGFPWLIVGYSQTNTPLKGYAPILSVYGVSLAVFVTSGLLLNAILKLKQKSYRSAYINILSMISIWCLGALLALIPWTSPNGEPKNVSLIQGNIPQAIKWSPEHLQLSFDRYRELTDPLWGKTDLIIWPEAAIPLPVQEAEPYLEVMDQKAKSTHTHLILGIPWSANKGYYNAVISLGDNKNRYLKRHLVPFGEYIPFENIFAQMLNFMQIPVSELVPGNYKQRPFVIDHMKILTSICFEIAFPELIHFDDETVGMLLTVTNDAWFGKSSAQAQHLQMAMMRALELRRPVLMIGNDGITAIIDAFGRVDAMAPSYQASVLTGKVQPTIGKTPWMRFAMDPVLFICILMLSFGIRAKILANRSLKLEADYRS